MLQTHFGPLELPFSLSTCVFCYFELSVFSCLIFSSLMNEPFFDSYVDRISNAKWELKELGLEHNGFVSLIYLLSATVFKILTL